MSCGSIVNDFEEQNKIFCFGIRMDYDESDSDDHHFKDGYHTKEIIQMWIDCDALAFPSLQDFHTFQLIPKHDRVSQHNYRMKSRVKINFSGNSLFLLESISGKSRFLG